MIIEKKNQVQIKVLRACKVDEVYDCCGDVEG